MRILVLQGSPRRSGNTVAMVEAFTEGAKSAGHEVIRFDVAEMNINGCKGCGFCHTEQGNGNCVQKDDMQEIYPEIKKADCIIFATPVYYWTMTAQMHTAFQRFYAPGKDIPAKKVGFLISSGADGVYDAIDYQMKTTFEYIGIEIAGMIKAHGEQNKTEEILDKCRAFGASM